MSYLNIRAPFNKMKIDSPEDLWSSFMDYMKHSSDTPIVEPKIFNGKEGVRYGNLDKIRPLTLNGLCNFVGMHPGTWAGWKKREQALLEDVEVNHSPYLLDVMLQIESIIYDNQFQGAAVDIFNAGIISRKLGLAEKRDHVSSDGSMTPTTEITNNMTPKEAAELYEQTLNPDEG